jgi:hypothetical protein
MLPIYTHVRSLDTALPDFRLTSFRESGGDAVPDLRKAEYGTPLRPDPMRARRRPGRYTIAVDTP